jgi:hypothetical protein
MENPVAGANENQAVNQNAEQESFFSKIFRMLMIYFLISSVYSMFKSPKVSPAAGSTKETISGFANILSESDLIDFKLFLSQGDTQELIWSESSLSYFVDESNERSFQMTLPVTPGILNNEEVSLIGEFRLHSSKKVSPVLVRKEKKLTKFTKKANRATVNLLSSEKVEVVQSEEAQHWVPMIDVYVVFDQTIYPQFPPQFEKKIQTSGPFYYPMIELSDFWVTREKLMIINDTLQELPLNFTFGVKGFYKSLFYMQFEESEKIGQNFGLHSEGEYDIMKKMILETNIYLLVATMIVSFVHMIFEFIAYKKEVQFWYGRENLTGLSVNLLVYNFIQTIVVFLYLLDSEQTSFAVWLPLGLGVVVEGWKVTKGFDIKIRRSSPYLSIKVKDSHKSSATNSFDNTATRMLGYLMLPVAFFYSVYGLYAYEYKSWYSWVVGTMASMIYTCGFVMMTPQLYINYKLKSVAHMPWDVLTYRALNTFIDDMFAFIISMPTMHRLACFRDDIIFVIFLYQKWIYKVDYNRHYLDSGSGGDAGNAGEVQNDKKND